jgi:crossover junction endodeoxyribonuclease RuvC
MVILGIDPGLSGAIAVLDLSNKLLAVHDMPTTTIRSGKSDKRQLSEAMLSSLVKQTNAQHSYLEFVSARPGQGVASMFNFGVGYGAIRGVLAGLGVPMSTVTPAKWQRDLNLAKGKDANRARAAQLFPEFAYLFSRVKDDGRADAALIAWWGARHAYMQKITESV